MAFDFKKEYKEYYMPPCKPELIDVPRMNYIAVESAANEIDEAFEQARAGLFAVAYTLNLSYLTDHRIEGFFKYVVPPLEGFWRFEPLDKSNVSRIYAIRLPDFFTKEDVDWGVQTAAQERGLDTGATRFLAVDEGLCVQMMHVGSVDNERVSLEQMSVFAQSSGLSRDFERELMYHEIFITDPSKTDPEKCRTVLRIPVR